MEAEKASEKGSSSAGRGPRTSQGKPCGPRPPRPLSARCSSKAPEEGPLPSSRSEETEERQQPRPDDFGLERFLEDGAPRPRQSGGLGTCFSTALLLAAARQPTRGARAPSNVVSRSTSPGSTLDSSTSGSLGGFSNISGQSAGCAGASSGTGPRRRGGYETAVPLPPAGAPRRGRRRREAT
eukprot:g11910.t1